MSTNPLNTHAQYATKARAHPSFSTDAKANLAQAVSLHRKASGRCVRDQRAMELSENLEANPLRKDVLPSMKCFKINMDYNDMRMHLSYTETGHVKTRVTHRHHLCAGKGLGAPCLLLAWHICTSTPMFMSLEAAAPLWNFGLNISKVGNDS